MVYKIKFKSVGSHKNKTTIRQLRRARFVRKSDANMFAKLVKGRVIKVKRK